MIVESKLSCEFTVPPPPMDKVIDEASIVVLYTPMGRPNPVALSQVPAPDLCDAMSFYVQGGKVLLCPGACAIVQADAEARGPVLLRAAQAGVSPDRRGAPTSTSAGRASSGRAPRLPRPALVQAARLGSPAPASPGACAACRRPARRVRATC